MTFTASNTEGTYSSAELELINRALEHMLEGADPEMRATLEGSFSDIIHNNFSDTGINTLASLTAVWGRRTEAHPAIDSVRDSQH